MALEIGELPLSVLDQAAQIVDGICRLGKGPVDHDSWYRGLENG